MDKATSEFLNAVDLQHAATSSKFKPLELLSMLSAVIWLRIESSKANDASDSSAFEQAAAYRRTPSSQIDGISLPEVSISMAPSTRISRPAPGLEQALHRLSTLPGYYRAVIKAYADTLPLNAENGPAESLEILDSITEHYKQQYPRDIQTTPRLVADLMAALVEPKPGETIYDPCCGLGGLLLAGAQVVKQGDGCILHGADINPDSCLLAAVRLFLSGTKYWNLNNHDALSKSALNAQVDIAADIVLATPPWGEFEQTASDDLSTTTISEALFSQHLVASIKPGGRGVIAVPDDFLSRKSYHEIRMNLAEECTIQGVISLPMGVYLPWSNRKISLLVLTKKGNTQEAGADLPVRMMILPEHQWRRASALPTSAETAHFISDTVQRFNKGNADRHIWERQLKTVEKFNMDLEAVRNPEEVLSELLHKIHRASLDVDIVSLKKIANVFLGSAIDEARTKSINNQTDHQVGVLRLTDIIKSEEDYSAKNPEMFIDGSYVDSIDKYYLIQEDDVLLAISGNGCQYVTISHFFENEQTMKIIPDDNFIIIRHVEDDDCENDSFNFVLFKAKEYQDFINFCLESDIDKNKLCNEILNINFPSMNWKFILDISKKIETSKLSELFSIHNYLDFLLKSEQEPVYLWLEKSTEVKNILDYKSTTQDPIHLIDKLAEGFFHVFDKKSNIDEGFIFWMNHMQTIMKRLYNISSVPHGPVRFLLLDNAEEKLSYIINEMFGGQFDFNTHPRLEMLSDYAAALMEDLIDILYDEKKIMLDTNLIAFSINPEYVIVGKSSSIVLNIENSGILPINNFVLSTTPNFGKFEIGYFSEKSKFKYILDIPSDNSTKEILLNILWKGSSIEGNFVTGSSILYIKKETVFSSTPVDNIFLYKPGFLIKNIKDVKDGTSYCSYHFRQALLGLENDFSGKTKPEIEETMFKKTNRINFNHISNLIREVKKSKLPIDVIVGYNKPFEVIYRDSAFADYINGLLEKSENKELDIHLTNEVDNLILSPDSEPDIGISPYIVGNPVDVEDMFFGRQDVIQSIQRQLSTEHKANVILLEGNRRTGKTSILKQLAKEDVLPKWVVVNCSFQAGDSTSGGLSTNEVFRLMAREIGRLVIKAGFQPWLPDQPAPDQAKKIEPQYIKALHQAFSTDYPMETFEMYLQNVIEAIKPRRLLLMLDEFDKLQEGIDAGVTSPSVPENIRYLLHTYDFTAILAGSRRIKRLRDEYWSALFGLGHRIGISALELDDARELVTRPVEGRLHYVDEARDRVVELCAGHPFLIQSLCTRIFELAAKNAQRNISLDVVEKSAQEMIADNEHFRTLWGYAGTETRRFLLSLCARLQSEPDPLSMSFLQEKLGQEGLRMEHDSLGSDIDFLMELELLVRDATSRTAIYSIGMPLMTLWIMKHIDHTEQRNRAIKEIKETS